MYIINMVVGQISYLSVYKRKFVDKFLFSVIKEICIQLKR